MMEDDRKEQTATYGRKERTATSGQEEEPLQIILIINILLNKCKQVRIFHPYI